MVSGVHPIYASVHALIAAWHSAGAPHIRVLHCSALFVRVFLQWGQSDQPLGVRAKTPQVRAMPHPKSLAKPLEPSSMVGASAQLPVTVANRAFGAFSPKTLALQVCGGRRETSVNGSAVGSIVVPHSVTGAWATAPDSRSRSSATAVSEHLGMFMRIRAYFQEFSTRSDLSTP